MANVILYTLLSVFIVSLASFVGILSVSAKVTKKHKVLLFLVSLSAGTLFGGAFLHLLPETIQDQGYTLLVSGMIIAGIITFFILEKIVHWHHCHTHFFGPKKHTHPNDKQHIGVLNMIGDGVHNFLDGLVIAGSYLINIPTGIATTIAVIIHELPQEFADFGVLIYSGFSTKKALFLNFLSALTAVLGALVGLFFASHSEWFLRIILPFAAGGFLYIAGSNLIPELHKESEIDDSIWHVFALLLGIALMYALTWLE